MARVGERWARVGIGAPAAAAALSALTLMAATPASAGGGDSMYPDRDRYEPGQQVTLVGYTQPVATRLTGSGPQNQPDWRALGPWYAYLRVDSYVVERDAQRDGGPSPWVHPTDLRLGHVMAEETSDTRALGALRVGLTFRLPDDLRPDTYAVVVCNDPCTMTLGWLFDFSSVPVGVDPEGPVVRQWPLDEPVIRYLDDDALIFDPVCAAACDQLDDWSVTAAEVRAGYRPTPTAVPAPPEPQPAATAATTRPPMTAPVADAGRSPAGRAGTDPAGGIPSEVVAWVMGSGALLIVWCLAWRWRPREPRIVVRQVNGQHGPPASDDDPRPVHVKL
jgi:hypothetical protein